MFVRLEDGTYVSKDIIGSVGVVKNQQHGFVAHVKDKRGQRLGDIKFAEWGVNFWDKVDELVVPAQPGFISLNVDDGEVFGFNAVLAWVVYTDSFGCGPSPVTVWGREDSSGVLQPDGKVFYQDSEYATLDEFKAYIRTRHLAIQELRK